MPPTKRCKSKSFGTSLLEKNVNGEREHESTTTNSDTEEQLAHQDNNFQSTLKVDEVLGKRIMRDGSIYYLLSWKNRSGEPTWEPETNCTCYEEIDQFNATVRHQRRASLCKPLIKWAKDDSKEATEVTCVRPQSRMSSTSSSSSNHDKNVRKFAHSKSFKLNKRLRISIEKSS